MSSLPPLDYPPDTMALSSSQTESLGRVDLDSLSLIYFQYNKRQTSIVTLTMLALQFHPENLCKKDGLTMIKLVEIGGKRDGIPTRYQAPLPNRVQLVVPLAPSAANRLADRCF